LRKKILSVLLIVFIVATTMTVKGFADSETEYYSALNAYKQSSEKENNAKKNLEEAQAQLKQVEELKASMQEELEQAKTDYNAAQERTNYLFNNIVQITKDEVTVATQEFNVAVEIKDNATADLQAAQAHYDEVLKITANNENIVNELAVLREQLKEKQNQLVQVENEIAKNQADVDNAGRIFLDGLTSKNIDYYIEIAKNNNLTPYLNSTKFKKTLKNCTEAENIKKALDFIDNCNQLRENHNVSALKVSAQLMNASMVSNSISAYSFNHTFAPIINIGENLAWGYIDPFVGWYDEEKILYEEHGGSYSSGNETTGHYENIIDSRYGVTGFAWDADYRYAQQSFYFDSGYTTGRYTTNQFRTKLNNLVNEFNNILQASQAKRENILNEIAVIELKIAEKEDILKGTPSLETAQKALNEAETNIEIAVQKFEQAEQNLENASWRKENAVSVERGNPESYQGFDDILSAVAAEEVPANRIISLTASIENKKQEISSLEIQILELRNTYNAAVEAKKKAKENFESCKVPASAVKVSKIYNKTYTGKYIYQAPFVTYNGKRLTRNVDYKVYHSKHLNVGIATVTIKFMGDYEGTVKKTFTIRPKGTYIRSLARRTRGLTARWAVVSKPYRTSISGYQVRYSRSPGFKTYNTYRTTRKTGSYAKISRLRKNTRYYVKVRTFRKVRGKYYYSTWSKIKSVRTR